MSDHESQGGPLSTALNALERKHGQILCVENLTREVGFSPTPSFHLFLLTSQSHFSKQKLITFSVRHCFGLWQKDEWVGHGTCAWRASCLLLGAWVHVEMLVSGNHSFYCGEFLRPNWDQGILCHHISAYIILLFTNIVVWHKGGASILVEAMIPRLGIKPRAFYMLG